MSATLAGPTEPTTDSLGPVPLVHSTSNHAFAGSFEFGLATPSGKFDAEHSTDAPSRIELLHVSAASLPASRVEHVRIDDLGEAGYRILQPIPIEITRIEIGNFEAWFREANIAMTGSDSSDALQALVAEILETFDVLLRERNLGPDAAEQRRILHAYIAGT